MYGIENLHGSAQAAATVGVVFTEAVVLYLGYGAVSRFTGTTILNALKGE